MFVRKRKAKRAKRKGGEFYASSLLSQFNCPRDFAADLLLPISTVRSSRGDDDGEDEDINPDRGAVNYAEHKFAFEKYETVSCLSLLICRFFLFEDYLSDALHNYPLQRFADEHILATLLTYLELFADFDSPEKMKRVVGLLHRLAVKVKAEGLFFKVSKTSFLSPFPPTPPLIKLSPFVRSRSPSSNSSAGSSTTNSLSPKIPPPRIFSPSSTLSSESSSRPLRNRLSFSSRLSSQRTETSGRCSRVGRRRMERNLVGMRELRESRR